MLGVHHPLLKSIRKAARHGGVTAEGLAIAEGVHLMEEALRMPGIVHALVVSERFSRTVGRVAVPVHIISDAAFAQISSVETNQGVLALVKLEAKPLKDVIGEGVSVALDGLQDPGNAGTILRTAEAFGAGGAVFVRPCVSPWNPKTIRASAGSALRLPIAIVEWEELAAPARDQGITLYAASPRGEYRVDETAWSLPAVILVGNEGSGIPPLHEEGAIPVRIPTRRVESLNAAMAAGILLYEACKRQ
jgi:TrmH family RNA methyltransferase